MKNPPRIWEAAQDCDMAVIGGGSMVYELALLGVPSIVSVQADNQERIAKYMNNNGLMKKLDGLSSLRVDALALLGCFRRRNKESAALKSALSRRGAENAAKDILSVIAAKSSDIRRRL